MNTLEQFYIDLDQSGWDVKQERDINLALQKVNEILFAEGELNLQHLAEIDRQVFHFSKTPEKGLSFRLKGTHKMEDGSEVPFEWPDITQFKNEDFNYLNSRFNTCQNNYAKTEYGLVLFYSKHKQENDFVIALLKALLTLLKSYIEKAKLEEKGDYIIYAGNLLSNALHIANKRKEISDVDLIFKELITLTFEVHQGWNVSNHLSQRTIIDFTNFAVQYFKDFKQTVPLDKFIDKNWEAAKFLSNTYVWGAIHVADISMGLSRKLGADVKDWLYFKAVQYESLLAESKTNKDLASLSFVEKAMSIYKSLKDERNLGRLQKQYQQLRAEFQPEEISTQLPQNEIHRINELVRKEVREKSEEEIIKTLLSTPMIVPIDQIEKWSEESNNEPSFLNTIPHDIKIKDKFGNTVNHYITDEDRKRYSLLDTYEFHLQIAMQTITYYFIEAFRADKISAKGIISLLGQSWIGDSARRRTNGREINFSYLSLLESGINSFFQELQKWKNDAAYYPNFVSATDSLILKVEYFLREICIKIGIFTSKEKANQPDVILEKTLDVLLNDLKGKIPKDDHFFIKFIMTEKAGYNLRNKVAHGLMDNIEYGLEYPILAIIIILKLSNYQFTPLNKDLDESTNNLSEVSANK